MDKTAWKPLSLEWTDGTSPNWQLPILWSGVLPSSMSRYCLGTSSKMDRWMSLQRGFPILQRRQDFYVISRGTEEGGSCPNPPTDTEEDHPKMFES